VQLGKQVKLVLRVQMEVQGPLDQRGFKEQQGLQEVLEKQEVKEHLMELLGKQEVHYYSHLLEIQEEFSHKLLLQLQHPFLGPVTRLL
jgi:hypothetical protein